MSPPALRCFRKNVRAVSTPLSTSPRRAGTRTRDGSARTAPPSRWRGPRARAAAKPSSRTRGSARPSPPNLTGRGPVVHHLPRVRIAYVVLSHRNPDQVLRLVSSLKEGPAGEILVRHDRRHSVLDESELERLGARSIQDDIAFEWGGLSHLQVLL